MLQGQDDRQYGYAAITGTYDNLPGVNGGMLSPAEINATTAMICDAVAPNRFANLNIEVGAKVIEWENSSDVDSDRKLFSHHHKNETDMGYSEKLGQSIVMTAETDTVRIDRYNADC